MKTIHKSTFRELVLAMLVSLPVLNFIMMTEKMMRLSRLLSSVGASPGELFTIILYIQPELLLLTLPMAFLLSVLYTYGRMNADSELIILRASGMSFREAAKPAFILGIVCVMLGLLVSFRLEPEGKRDLRLAITNTLRLRAPSAIEPGTFNTFVKDTVIYAMHGEGRRLSGVFIYDERKPDRPVVIYAKTGGIEPTPDGTSFIFNLKDGLIHFTKGSRLIEIFFRNYNLLLPLSLDEPGKRLGELTPGELLKEAGQMKGLDKTRRYLELDSRLTYPLLSFAMMFLAPVLSLYSGRRARLGGLAMGTFIFAFYYVMLTYSQKLSEAGKLPHIIGGWGPFLIVLAVSLRAFRKVNRR
ncbi:MAG: LptF/LptG family permease [Nitrospiraceae bacterium]|nr:LptF/LptG family permease [Nitrospiraceae bacterium]